MKIVEGFRLRDVLGEKVVVPEGLGVINFNKMISLNASAAYLWENVADREFSVEDLAELLVEKYEIDPETALKDATALAESWVKEGVATR